MNDDDIELTPGQAAEILGIHPRTLNRQADAGKVAFTRTEGGHRRYLLSVIQRIKLRGDFALAAEVERNHPHQEDK